MKSAMQELKDIIENHGSDNIPKDNLLNVINLMSLEKEKQQIIDAYNVEIYDGINDDDQDAEQYYTNTFKQD